MSRDSRHRNETVEQFKQRLAELIDKSGLSRTAVAARIGVDRSTLTQVLAEQNVRLPRAETVAAIAAEFHVSSDWLLGLSQTGEPGIDLVEDTVSIAAGDRRSLDALLRRWHAEAVGYKVRYVPTTLPDLLKTEEVIRFEHGTWSVPPESHIERAGERLAWNRRPETDMEVCSSVQSVLGFALGEGIWRGLAPRLRGEQLRAMAALVRELYPTSRWFLFDGQARYSAPLTVFGPLRGAVYLGDRYLVLSGREEVRALIEHFDHLIRLATVQAADVADYIDRCRESAGLR